MSGDIGADRGYLRYQYADAQKFQVRVQTHATYSELPGDFMGWLVAQVGATPGSTLLDVGCGPGNYHPLLPGVRVTGCDASAGMLREAAAQALRLALDVRLVAADAEALPFRDASFDYVMGNHMLYHVPDQAAALREMRRVIRPGGRVVLATNGPVHLEVLWAMHETAAESAGYVSAGRLIDRRFTLADIGVVRSVFPSASVVARDDALVFPAPEPLLAYYATFMVDNIDSPPTDGSHRPRILAAMQRIAREVIEREGRIRIPKTAGCFIVDV